MTVKGHPRLALKVSWLARLFGSANAFADYASGSDTDTLVFTAPADAATATKLDFNGGAIVATEAAAILRFASTTLP